MKGMKSPFPGMDPYLERRWLDVHTRMVAYASDQLNERLPADLAARTEERLSVESEGEEDSTDRIAPDVRVVETRPFEVVESAQGGGVLAAPFKLVLDLDPQVERYIKIVGPDDERLITVIELISPSNKIGRGLEKFLKKRDELIEAGVNIVEIDLVRRGDWRALLKPHMCPREMVSEYRVTVRPGGQWSEAYLYPVDLRKELPRIAIPLRKGDPQVFLDLQQLVTDAYVRGRYMGRLNYRGPLDPPLMGDDAQCAAEIVRNGE